MPPRKPTSKNGGCSPRVMLAAELARLREESGRSLRELSDKVGWDHAHLHNLERGKGLGGPELVEALDMVYRTTPFLIRLWEIAKNGAAFQDKYQRVLELESTAAVIEHYVTGIIPGILQTEAYARVLLWSAPHGPENVPWLEEQLAARLGRQEVLGRCPAPQVRVVLGEMALKVPLPNLADWREQLARLVAAAAEPHVMIQVLPFSAGLHSLLDGSLMLLRTADGRETAWEEGSSNGELFEDVEQVERYRLAYDTVRALAFSPRDSVAFIQQLMEDFPCDPAQST